MWYRLCFFSLLVIIFMSCGKKKKKMAGEEDVTMQDFVEFFTEVELPFMYADSSLYAKTDDSLLISTEVFNKFTPDSILSTTFGKDEPKLHAIGKFSEKDGTVYLMSKASTTRKKVMLVAAYNKKNEFIAVMPIMDFKKEKGITTSVVIDKLFNIHRKTAKKLPDDLEINGDDVYVLNSATKGFILIMTDSLGDDVELINPIDTLGSNYKYAGDYGQGSRNIISIRDDIRAGRVQFFVHLENEDSKCSGELRGEASITSDNTVVYKKLGDPCTLQFTFDKNSVTLQEVAGCGSRMGGLDCTFNGRYTRKKDK